MKSEKWNTEVQKRYVRIATSLGPSFVAFLPSHVSPFIFPFVPVHGLFSSLFVSFPLSSCRVLRTPRVSRWHWDGSLASRVQYPRGGPLILIGCRWHARAAFESAFAFDVRTWSSVRGTVFPRHSYLILVLLSPSNLVLYSAPSFLHVIRAIAPFVSAWP